MLWHSISHSAMKKLPKTPSLLLFPNSLSSCHAHKYVSNIRLLDAQNGRLATTVMETNLRNDEERLGELAHLLKTCAVKKTQSEGKTLHARIIKYGFECHFYLANHLVTMYSKSGNLVDACQVFDKMPERNAVSWTTLIAGYAQDGCHIEAMKLFSQMNREGIPSDCFSLSSVLHASSGAAAVEPGKQLHAHILKLVLEGDVFVGSALVDMYVKCAKMKDAQQVFENMPKRNVVSWTAMISGYAQNGHGEEAFKLFSQMLRVGVQMNLVTFACVLTAFASPEALEQGSQVHGHIVKAGLEADVSVANALVTMYVKCGNVEDACCVFDGLPDPNLVSWTAMIAGYVQHERSEEALELFTEMKLAGLKPNQFTFASVIKGCTGLAALEQGRQMHSHVIKSGTEWDVFVGNSLVTMYAKCQNMEFAQKAFKEISTPNVISYTALVAGYAQNEQCVEALDLFCKMQQLRMEMDHFVFATALNASASLAALEQGSQLHTHVVKVGFESDLFIKNALLDMIWPDWTRQEGYETLFPNANWWHG